MAHALTGPCAFFRLRGRTELLFGGDRCRDGLTTKRASLRIRGEAHIATRRLAVVTAELIARVDGLPVVLLERERIFPVPAGGNGSTGRRPNGRRALSARERARVERETAAVHTAVLPRSIRAMLDDAELTVGTFFAAAASAEEDAEIRAALAAGGLL
jgi:hypothetical protein